MGRPDQLTPMSFICLSLTVFSLVIFLSSKGPHGHGEGYRGISASHTIKEEATFWCPVEIAVAKSVLLNIH